MFTTASEKKYMATALIGFVLAGTIVFKIFVVRKFLTFTFLCEFIKKSEDNKFTQKDIDLWYYYF